MPTPYIDSHAHLYFDVFDDDRDEVVARAREAGCLHVLNIGIDVASTRQALDLAARYPGFCFASAGLHPTSSGLTEAEQDDVLGELRDLIDSHRESVLAVGEIGLDFYWDTASPEAQRRAFRRQLELARECALPVVIHCRDAWEETLAIVSEHPRVRGVFHCFGGTPEQASTALSLGWHVSFAGNVTYPKAPALREAASRVPLDRLLLETDAPFLAPQARRGKRNEPAFAVHTAAALADALGVEEEELLRRTTENARTLFGFGGAGGAGEHR